MSMFRILRTAMHALRRNVMRSVLTILGIIIGVGAVIAMMEIGQGTSALLQKQISSMGANNLTVMPGTAASGGISFGAGSVMTLTPDDAEAVAADCPAVRAVAPIVRTRAVQLIYGNKNWIPQQILGTTPDYLDVRDWTTLDEGAPFSDQDVRNASKVCLIGKTIANQLFENESPIGKDLRIQSVSFKVVGVLSKKGSNMVGMDQDDVILAPWTTIKFRVSSQSTANSASSSGASSATSSAVNTLSALYPSVALALFPVQSAIQQADTPQLLRFTNIDQILVAARSADEIPAAMKQITDVIRQRHRLHEDEPEDFQIRDMTEMTNMFSSTTKMMTNLLLSVAAISLLVGGVGIMNIMLVSVTERTREIGLRMAVGARARDILRQFLVEAVMLCLAGGAIGIIFGRGGSYLVRTFLKFPTAISIPAIVASVIVAGSVGIIFGYYPAWKASRLDPIEALRYE